MVDAVATMALETLRDLFIEEAKFLSSVGGQVEDVRRQLQTMHCYLKDADKRRDSYKPEIVRDWILNLRELSLQTENVLERYAIQVTSRREGQTLKKILKRFTCILGEISDVHQIGKEIQDIISRMTDLTNRAELSVTKLRESGSSSSVDPDTKWSRKTYGYELEQHFVGMKDDLQLLESLITSDNRSNSVISICGMGGSGKTTLATKIYNWEAVQRCFEVRAWICVSQQFQHKTLLQELLKQFLTNEDEKKIREMEEDELVTKLFDVQNQKKCLVVVDDIWEIDDWNSLSRFFRIAEDRCKLLVTTRNEKIGAGEFYVHKLRDLSEDEGWELLQKIALPINHSQELSTMELKLLEGIGREVVRKCGCLPLAVSVIGGILRQEKTSNGWERVCKNIDSYLQRGNGVEVNKRVTQVLDLSYNVLPYNLKSCFLYLACFPEDTEIRTEELYLLWMAGGMISSQDRGREETLTEVAERYLCELANRCMIQVKMDEYSVYSRFRSCRLHDLMRDLCLTKGNEEGLLEVVDTEIGRQEDFSVSWLSIHMNKPGDNISEYKNLRSLMFPMKGWRTFREWNSSVSVNIGLFKSLKILILQGFNFGNGKLPKGIETLVLLKHLSVENSEVDELPSYICKLPRVHSLNFRTYRRIRVHNSIYKMGRLRHLFLRKYQRETIGGGQLKLDGLDELETLIGFNSRVDDINHLLKLSKLRVFDGAIHNECNLSMIVDHFFNHQDQFWNARLTIEEGCNVITSEADNSTLLRKTLMCHSMTLLNIECRLNRFPLYEPQFGRNLITLALSSSNISQDSMEMLEKLPKLQMLTFRKDSFVGTEMVYRANGFLQLRRLYFAYLPNLVDWTVEEKAMPNLSDITIYGCQKMEKIPEGLKFIPTIKQLIIGDMPENFTNRVKVVDGQEGDDYHKIKHIPSIKISKEA